MNAIKRIFCKHDYVWCRKIEPFQNLSGERHYLVCQKCGKIKDSKFVKTE